MKFTKDPNAILDYRWDYSEWLTDDDTIVSAEASVPSGRVEIQSTDFDETSVTVWLAGGKVGEETAVQVTITTDDGRVDDRTTSFVIVNR